MTSITLKVNGAEIRASVAGTLTSGMVGIPVTIEYDEAWEGLTKNLVCRCSKSGFDNEEYRSILNVGNTAVVAHEVMQAGKHLWLGVEGYSPDGTLVIPTTWAMCGVIQRGANTGDDLSADPTLPVWGQLQTQIDRIEGGSIPPEQLEEIRAFAEAAAQAEENAAAASRLAADHADTARANGEAAQIYMENARTSAASAANMASDAFRYQTAAEAAADRAEASVGFTTYAELPDKPRINGVELSGDKTAEELGIGQPSDEQVATAVKDYLDEHPIDGSGLYDGAVKYNHIDGIAYVGEPTDEEIGGDSGEAYVNLFDKNTMLYPGVLSNGQNNPHPATDGNTTCKYAIIPVIAGETYSMQTGHLTFDFSSGGVGSVQFRDADGNLVYRCVLGSGVLANTFGAVYDASGNIVDAGILGVLNRADNNGIGMTFGVPAGCSFIWLNIIGNSASGIDASDTFMIETGMACHEYVPFGASDGDSETPDISGQTNLKGCEITELFGATLRDSYARQNVARLQQKVDDFAGSASFDDTLIDRGVRTFGYRVEPAQGDIPDVYITGDAFSEMNSTKNEVKMAFKYLSKSKVFGGWLKIKWQGNLSLNFPKHNFTVKLYGDKPMKRKLKVDLGGWGEQNKFVWKANYIDRSHARNIVSARLWADMVASRTTYDKRMMYAPNHGAIDGFPFRLFVNGEYYGLMTWNIPKDGWMTQMTEDNPNHCLMCAELNGNDNSPCDFAADWNATAWEVEFPDEISNGLVYSFNDIIACVVNDSDEDFTANIDSHLDIASAIDYYIFFYLNAGIDSLAKNMLLMTYDGVKWYCGAYDMDAVWGRNFEGLGPISAETKCPEGYANTDSRLWPRIETCFGQELHDRYFDLRETILSKEYIMAKFRQFVEQIPEAMYAEDAEKNGGMRGVSGEAFLEEIGTWLDGRFAYVDAQMEAMAPAVS